MKQPITLTINGEQHALLVEAYWSLLDTLRDHLHLTGTKKAKPQKGATRRPRKATQEPEARGRRPTLRAAQRGSGVTWPEFEDAQPS